MGLVLSSIIFKIIVAIIDTPLLYLLVGLIRKKFHLAINDEIEKQSNNIPTHILHTLM